MFKDNLVSLRKKAGISQEQLASELGLSRQSISKYELGTAEPDLAKLHALKDFFKVTYDELLDEEVISLQPTKATTGTITIQSEVNDRVLALRSFWIAKTFGVGHKRVKAALIGNGGILDLDMVTLGYFTTRDNAKQELKAIQEAISYGKATYALQYNVKTVKGGFLGLSTRLAENEDE